MSVKNINRKLSKILKKEIVGKLTKTERSEKKKLLKQRSELKKESPSYKKKNENFKKLTGDQISITKKIKNLEKKATDELSSYEKKKVLNQISRLTKKKITVQEKKFKNSKQYLRILESKKDLVKQDRIIKKILSSENEMKSIDKTKQRDIFKKMMEIQEDIEAVNETLKLPIVEIKPDGYITADDLRGELDDDLDFEEDEVGIWEVKQEVEKKLSFNKEKLDEIEVFFPNGRLNNIDLTSDYQLEWEAVITAFYNEVDNIRLNKKGGTPTALVIYNYSKRKISISSNFTLK